MFWIIKHLSTLCGNSNSNKIILFYFMLELGIIYWEHPVFSFWLEYNTKPLGNEEYADIIQ